MSKQEQIPQDADNDTTPRPIKKRRWWRGLALFFVTLIVVLWWMVGTTAGLKFVLFKLPQISGVATHATKTQGNLWRGFSLDDFTFDNTYQQVTIDRLHGHWDLSHLWRGRVHIYEMVLGHVQIINHGTSSDTAASATTLPQNIDLPIQLEIEKISLAALTLGESQEALLTDVQLSYSNAVKAHAIQLQKLTLPWGRAEGVVTIERDSPFQLDGNIQAVGQVENEPVAGVLNLTGSLKNIMVNAVLSGTTVSFDAKAAFNPFAETIVQKVDDIYIHMKNMNPQAFWHAAPEGLFFMQFELKPDQAQERLQGKLVMNNKKSLPLGARGMPLVAVTGQLAVNNAQEVRLDDWHITFLRRGQIMLTGDVKTAGAMDWNLQADIHALTGADLFGGKPVLPLNGRVQVKGEGTQPKILWHFQRGILEGDGQIDVAITGDSGSLKVRKANVRGHEGSYAALGGALTWDDQVMQWQGQFKADKFNPGLMGGDFPTGQVNGQMQFLGQVNHHNISHSLETALQLKIDHSQLSGVIFQGDGRVNYQQGHLQDTAVDIRLGQNKIAVLGSLGRAEDRLQINIQAPDLSQFGFGLHGRMMAKGDIAGSFHNPRLKLKGGLQQVVIKNEMTAEKLDFDLQLSPDLDAPLRFDIEAKALVANHLVVRHFNLNTQGSLRHHQLTLDAAARQDQRDYQASLAVAGGLQGKARWQGKLTRFNLSDPANIQLQQPMNLAVSQAGLQLGESHWKIFDGQVRIQNLTWQNGDLRSSGSIQALRLSDLQKMMTLPVEQNLVFDGDWDVVLGRGQRGFIHLRQVGGDMKLPGRVRTVGLDALQWRVDIKGEKTHHTLGISTRFGQAALNADVDFQAGRPWHEAKLSGNLNLESKELDELKYLLPPGIDLGGMIVADLMLNGHLNAPEIYGPVTAEDLEYLDLENGLTLKNGSLSSHFEGQRWVIDQLLFSAEEGGKLRTTGYVEYAKQLPVVALKVHFNQYPAQTRPDRLVVLSGDAELGYTAKDGLALTGDLVLDKAVLDFPESGMPTLDDDVVVVGEKERPKDVPLLLSMAIGLDLNHAFRFSGQGLDVLMDGKLKLEARPKEDINITGTVNVVSGGYKAYGQNLKIEYGTITFNGPLVNPVLNIRALRRNSPVDAGVEVTGPLDQPRALLISNTPMSDKEKLAWLVLGRALDAESDDSALAASLGMLLAESVNHQIGLVDDIGVSTRRTRDSVTGEMNPAEQMITVGKHLSGHLYLGYEYGIDSASQAMRLIYQLSRSLQLITRIGTDSSGGEVRYIRRFD